MKKKNVFISDSWPKLEQEGKFIIKLKCYQFYIFKKKEIKGYKTEKITIFVSANIHFILFFFFVYCDYIALWINSIQKKKIFFSFILTICIIIILIIILILNKGIMNIIVIIMIKILNALILLIFF